MSRLAVIEGMSKDVKAALMTLHGMGSEAEECIDLLQTAFLYNSPRPLNDCRTKLTGFRAIQGRVMDDITRLEKEYSFLKLYEQVPVYLINIGNNIEKLMAQIDRRIQEGILFSDRAVDEVTYLLQRLTDILRPASDIILARNDILFNYIAESEGDVAKKALEYATRHEERLVEGVCNSTAAPVYLNMLDAIKAIAWNAKEMSKRLMA